MENPSDDPREFQQSLPGGMDTDSFPAGMDNFLRLFIYQSHSGHSQMTSLTSVGLQTLMNGGVGGRSASPTQNEERSGLVSACVPLKCSSGSSWIMS
jgi:hypothetical protein